MPEVPVIRRTFASGNVHFVGADGDEYVHHGAQRIVVNEDGSVEYTYHRDSHGGRQYIPALKFMRVSDIKHDD